MPEIEKEPSLIGKIVKTPKTFLAVLAIIVPCLLALANTVNTNENDNKKDIEFLKDELHKVLQKNGELNLKLAQHSVYIDYLKNNLLFVYTRSDLPTNEQWRKSLIEHMGKAEKDLSFEQ